MTAPPEFVQPSAAAEPTDARTVTPVMNPVYSTSAPAAATNRLRVSISIPLWLNGVANALDLPNHSFARAEAAGHA
jgi:hypothetical protein